MSEVYLKPVLKQETECIQESKVQDDTEKRFEEWLNSLRPIELDPEVEEKMILETIEHAKILNSYLINK